MTVSIDGGLLDKGKVITRKYRIYLQAPFFLIGEVQVWTFSVAAAVASVEILTIWFSIFNVFPVIASSK